jgi:hexosaminidase
MTRLLRLLSLSSSILLSLQVTHALWPQPHSIQTGFSALRLAPQTSFTITVAFPNPPADLLAAVARTRTYLFTDTLARLVPSHGAEDLPTLANASTKALPGLTLRLEAEGAVQGEGEGVSNGDGVVVAREIAVEARAGIEEREEGYWLDVPAEGSGAVLSARSTLGLFRGLNTFAQLWFSYGESEEDCDGADAGDDGDGVVVYTLSAPVTIQDAPAYVSSVFLYSRGTLTRADMGSCSHIVGSCWTRRGISEWTSLLPRSVLFDRLWAILVPRCLTLNALLMRCHGSTCVSICSNARGERARV